MRCVVGGVVLWCIASGTAVGQQSRGALRGGEGEHIRGRVTDAETGRPVAWAAVTVCLTADASCTHGRSATADSAGLFRIGGLGAGSYRVTAAQAGYASRTVTVELPSVAALGLALELAPVLLEPVRVSSSGSGVLGSAVRAGTAATADAAAEARAWLPQDAAVQAMSAVPRATGAGMVGGDVLRGLRALPGVDGPDDFVARLWVRGGDWSETRVYFDGVPLFDPVHASGMYSALGTFASGRVVLTPGLQPVARASGAAAALDVTTQPASATGAAVEASSEAIAATVAAVHPRVQVAGGARTAWLGALSRRIVGSASDTTPDFPFRFSDATARMDVRLSDATRVEASAHGARDRLVGTSPPLRSAASEGETAAARLGVVHDIAGIDVTLFAGWSHHAGRVDWVAPASDVDTVAPHGAPPQLRQRIGVRQIGAEVAATRWRIGSAVAHQEHDYAGPVPVPGELGAPHSLGSMHESAVDTRFAAWGNVVLPLSSALRVTGGARATLSGAGGGVEPRASVQFGRNDTFALEVAAALHHQYEQSVGWAGVQVGPRLESAQLLLPAGAGVPVIRAALVSIAADADLSIATLRLRAYRRSASGHLIRSPAAGPLLLTPPVVGGTLAAGWTYGRSTAAGIEAGVTRDAERYRVALGYTLARASIDADGRRFAASTDRRHAADALLVARPVGSLQLGVRAEAGSGTPFTRFYSDACDHACRQHELGRVGPAGEGRTGGYIRLDMSAEWQQRVGAVRVDLGAGVINVAGARGSTIYTGTSETDIDRFVDGWPRTFTTFIRIGF